MIPTTKYFHFNRFKIDKTITKKFSQNKILSRFMHLQFQGVCGSFVHYLMCQKKFLKLLIS